MSAKIPSWRGCASNFPQPLSHDDELEAQSLVNTVDRVNCKEANLQNIVYRSGDAEKDILRQVFRWDVAPYVHVFEHGLQSHPRKRIHKKAFYNLYSYVQSTDGRPLDSRKPSSFAFISTTISNSWYPPVLCDGPSPRTIEVYRYEIYAPGGIWTSLTLGDKDGRNVQRFDEVAFVGGIAPQFIRSAQLFRLTGNSDGTTTVERVDNVLMINDNFNPQSHPLRLLNIENPISDYSEDGSMTPLTQSVHQPSSPNNNNANIIDWYARDVINNNMYMTASFRSSHLNEAYYILQNWCTLLYYDPGGSDDYVVDGPSVIANMFKSLEYTPFGEHGIDSAMQIHDDEAFIFSANLVALINYAPDTKNDKIIKGPMTIAEMFPFLRGTVFEDGIDAVCEHKSVDYESYLIKGNLCAHVNVGPNPRLIELGQICHFFPLLKGSVLEGLGIDATYASHAENDMAYFFKYNNYGKIYVDPNGGVDPVLGVWVMGANAPVIQSFLPRKNRGLDMRANPTALPYSDGYDHDGL